MRLILVSALLFLGAGTNADATSQHAYPAAFELVQLPAIGSERNADMQAAGLMRNAADPDLTNGSAFDENFLRRFGPDSDVVGGHVHFRSDSIMSGLREDRAYVDDPDSALWLIPVNWDARTGSLIPIQAIFGEPADSEPAYIAIAKKLRKAITLQVWAGNPQDWQSAIEEQVQPDPMGLSIFTFVPSTEPDRIGGIAWHFEPETVAPLSKGIISIVIPQKKLRDIIHPDWQDMFGGEPANIPAVQHMPEVEQLAERQLH